MPLSTHDLRDKVFIRTDGNNTTRDMRSFNVLMAIDGKRSVGTIATEDHYELQDLAEIIERLLNDGSIKPLHSDAVNVVDKNFFNHLEAHLGRIMGPVSTIIIEEQLAEFGLGKANWPVSKAYELISRISASIPDKRESDAFVSKMNSLLDQ